MSLRHCYRCDKYLQDNEENFKPNNKQCRHCVKERNRACKRTDGGTDPKASWRNFKRNAVRRGHPTTSTYEEYLIQFNKTHCECCGVQFDWENPRSRRAIDHDHKTGKIRGALCTDCNLCEGRIKTSDNAYNLYLYMLKHDV